jgi:hypothetical protein
MRPSFGAFWTFGALGPRSRRVVLAFVTEKKIVKEILEHLGLQTTGPPVAPARIAAASEDAPWQDDLPELQQTLRWAAHSFCAYALISPCAVGCSHPRRVLVVEDGVREEGGGDRTALIRPSAPRIL